MARSVGRSVTNRTDDIFCMDFYFVHTTGDRLYPCKVKNLKSGKIAFRVSEGENTIEGGLEVDGAEDMKRYVLEMGYSVRANTLKMSRGGLFNPEGRSIKEVVVVR